MQKQMQKPKVRLEISPYVTLGRTKIKQRMMAIGSSGQPIEKLGPNNERIRETVDADVTSLIALPGTKATLSPQILSNGLNTGLNVMVENPYQNLDYDADYNPEWGLAKLKGKTHVLLQHKLEYEHAVPFDYYRSRFPAIQTAHYDDPNVPYFARPDSRITISNNTTFLDLNNPQDELRYYWLKQHPHVAGSFKELENEPKYKYYITEENEKETVQANTKKIMLKAASLLNELDERTDDVLIDMALILNGNYGLTKEQALLYIDRYINESSDKLREFMKWYTTWKEKGTRNEFNAAARLAEYCNAGIIRRRDSYYFCDLLDEASHRVEHFEYPNRELCIKGFLTAPEMASYIEIVKGKYQDWLIQQSFNNSKY